MLMKPHYGKLLFKNYRRNLEEPETAAHKKELMKVHIQLLETRAQFRLLLDALAIDGDGDVSNSQLIQLIRSGVSNELVLEIASKILNRQKTAV
jgi:molecular chaperone GrpE (heat shock protein)